MGLRLGGVGVAVGTAVVLSVVILLTHSASAGGHAGAASARRPAALVGRPPAPVGRPAARALSPSLAALLQAELVKLSGTPSAPAGARPTISIVGDGLNTLGQTLELPRALRGKPRSITGWSCAVATGSPCGTPARTVFAPEAGVVRSELVAAAAGSR